MRATKGYLAGLGTTSALVAAIACAFTILSAVVAVRGWTGAPSAPPVSTLDGRAAGLGEPFGALLGGGRFGPADGARADGPRRAQRDATGRGDGAGAGNLLARLEAPGGGSRISGVSGQGAAAASSAAGGTQRLPGSPPGSGGSDPRPGEPDEPSGGGLGGAVTQVASGAGAAVTQAGQQLGGAVQGTSGQLGGAVGAVSPAAGQIVTQTGAAAGGAVGGASEAAGQVLADAGGAIGGVLGGLGGSS
jgi:hypothetical protein